MWVDIPGFEDRYQVSDEGEIRSLDHFVRTKSGSYCLRKGKILKPQDTWDHYYAVGLYDSTGKYFVRTIHRIVASVFIPNPNNYPVVNHLDCDTHNNHKSNLEWTTVQGNTLHAVANGRFHIDPDKIRKASEAGAKKRRKPLICIETGEIFMSAAECLKSIGKQVDLLRYISHGRDICGLHYQYLNSKDQQYALDKYDKYILHPPSKHNSKKR